VEIILHSSSNQKGVSLIELMITVTIVATLLIVVAPNIQGILIKNRIAGEINELSSIIQFARNNAIDEQIETIVCPSEDFSVCTTNWNHGKIVYADLDGNGERGAAEGLLVATSSGSELNKLTGPAADIQFQPSGAANSTTALLLCHKDGENKYARQLNISLQGRVKMSRDANNDGIYEDVSGIALNCP
jgi:type IV fimbrial biogenesis protein FimT